MATVNYTTPITKLGGDSYMVVWETLTENDTATPIDMADLPAASGQEKCVQVTGTFGSGNVSLEGSNDGTNYHILNDPLGTAITLSAAGLYQVLEYPRYVRPKTPTGSSVDVDVYLLLKGER